MTIDLHSLSLKDLKDLQTRVTRAIATFEQRKKADAIAALEEQAKTMGYSLADLFRDVPSKRKPRLDAKYANPADQSQTWSGRGRRPRWIEAALKSGGSLDDMRI